MKLIIFGVILFLCCALASCDVLANFDSIPEFDLGNNDFYYEKYGEWQTFENWTKRQIPPNWGTTGAEEFLKVSQKGYFSYEFINQLKQMEKLSSLLNSYRPINPEELLKLAKSINLGDKSLLADISNGNYKLDHLKSLLREHKNGWGNVCFGVSSILSAMTIISEFNYISNVAQELDVMDNMVEESKNNFTIMKSKISQVRIDVDKLHLFAMKAMEMDMDKNIMDRAVRYINRQTNMIRKKTKKIRNDLENIKVSTKNGIERLGQFESELNRRLTMNIFHTTASAIAFGFMYGHAAPIYLVVQGAITIGHGVCAWNTYNTKVDINEKIASFRSVLNMTRMFEIELEQLDQVISEAELIASEYDDNYLPDELKIIAFNK